MFDILTSPYFYISLVTGAVFYMFNQDTVINYMNDTATVCLKKYYEIKKTYSPTHPIQIKNFTLIFNDPNHSLNSYVGCDTTDPTILTWICESLLNNGKKVNMLYLTLERNGIQKLAFVTPAKITNHRHLVEFFSESIPELKLIDEDEDINKYTKVINHIAPLLCAEDLPTIKQMVDINHQPLFCDTAIEQFNSEVELYDTLFEDLTYTIFTE